MSLPDFGERFFSDFTSFLISQNILGLMVGSLLATNASDIGRSVTSHIVLPIVRAMFSKSAPDLQYTQVAETLIAFVVAVALIYLVIRLFKVSPSMPIGWTRVTNADEIADKIASRVNAKA